MLAPGLTLVSIVLLVFAWRFPKRRAPTSLLAVYAGAVRPFLVSVAVAGVALSVVQIWLMQCANRAQASGNLRDLEETVSLIETYVSGLQVSAVQWFVIVVSVVTLSLLPATRSAGRSIPWLAAARKTISVMYTLAAVLTSFTFFGGAVALGLAHPQIKLRASIVDIYKGYGELLRETETIATSATQQELENVAEVSELEREIAGLESDLARFTAIVGPWYLAAHGTFDREAAPFHLDDREPDDPRLYPARETVDVEPEGLIETTASEYKASLARARAQFAQLTAKPGELSLERAPFGDRARMSNASLASAREQLAAVGSPRAPSVPVGTRELLRASVEALYDGAMSGPVDATISHFLSSTGASLPEDTVELLRESLVHDPMRELARSNARKLYFDVVGGKSAPNSLNEISARTRAAFGSTTIERVRGRVEAMREAVGNCRARLSESATYETKALRPRVLASVQKRISSVRARFGALETRVHSEKVHVLIDEYSTEVLSRIDREDSLLRRGEMAELSLELVPSPQPTDADILVNMRQHELAFPREGPVGRAFALVEVNPPTEWAELWRLADSIRGQFYSTRETRFSPDDELAAETWALRKDRLKAQAIVAGTSAIQDVEIERAFEQYLRQEPELAPLWARFTAAHSSAAQIERLERLSGPSAEIVSLLHRSIGGDDPRLRGLSLPEILKRRNAIHDQESVERSKRDSAAIARMWQERINGAHRMIENAKKVSADIHERELRGRVVEEGRVP